MQAEEENIREEIIEVISGQDLARANEVLPNLIHLLPVSARPFFPGQAVPLLMEQEHWESTMEAVTNSPHSLLGVVLSDAESAERATPDTFKAIGTVCRV
ncbi:MAG: endopeptidase La, partial [Candidatus Thiodiazotropha sp. (ex Lucinoma borealis)]|nr:endopeptidase La [Candidatus Thiodiazotropha sp. (ex Lucinoma borealis)]